MTIGELVALLSSIPRIIELIAISILVLGFYKMWAVKKQLN
jgi:uncharacterized membrane protein